MEISECMLKWILCFASTTPEGKQDISVYESLNGLPLMSLAMDISVESRKRFKAFNIESYNILDGSLGVIEDMARKYEMTSAHKASETEKAKNIAVFKACEYKKIDIPISKPLYMKIIEIMKNDDRNVCFTDSEIAEFTQHLSLFINEKIPILYQINHQMRYDEDLKDRIEKLCSTQHADRNKTELTDLYTRDLYFYNLILEIQNVIYYRAIEDKCGNMLLASETGEYERQSPMPINFEDFKNLPVPRFIKMESKFLITNRKYMKGLCTHFSKNGTNRIVIDVDFSDICNKEKNWKDMCHSIKTKRDVKSITSKFLKANFVKRLIIRLKKVLCNFSMFFPENENVELYLYSCTIDNGIILPHKLTRIYIINSTINTSLDMPKTLGVFVFQRTVIKKECDVSIDSDCLSITIDRATGVINIPFVKEYIRFNFRETIWSFELQQSADGLIDKLTISDCTFEENLCIGQIVRVLTLANITVLSESKLIMRDNIENVIMTKVSGSINLFGPNSVVPFQFDLDYGKLMLIKSRKDDGSKELTLSKASWDDVVNLSGVILKIEDSGISQYNSFKFHGIKLTKIVLDRCNGKIAFNDRADGIIIDGYINHFSIQDLNKPIDFLFNNTTYVVNCFELTIRGVSINTSLKLSFNIKKIYLEYVCVAENSIVQIDSGFESITMATCFGKYLVPNISYNDESLINLLDYWYNQIEIVQTPKRLYNIAIIDMDMESEFKIQTDVDHVKLRNVSVIEGSNISFDAKCNSLELICFRGHLSFSKTKIFDRLVVYDLDLTRNNDFAPFLAKNFLKSETATRNDTSLTSCSCAPYCTQKKLKTMASISLHANRSMKIFPPSNDNTPVDIMDIVNNITIIEPEQIMKEKEFPVISFLSTSLDKLVLEDLCIGKEYEIIGHITELQIISTKGSALRINANVKNLFVGNSTLTIDISRANELETLTLVNSLFIYDRNAYQYLSYLRLDKVIVNRNVNLTDKLKTLIIESTKICGGFVLRIGPTVVNLSVQRFTGAVNIPSIFGSVSIMLYGNEVIELCRDKHSLILKGFTFKGDVELDDNFRIVRLSEVKMSSGRKVILNKECVHLELDSSDVNIDYSKIDDLKCITLTKDIRPVAKNILALKTVTTATFKGMKFKNGFICPANIRVISLHCVRMLGNKVFRIGKNCEEITLFNCIGNFDLSRATCLKKLAVIPFANRNTLMVIKYPSLDRVIDLELAYELSGKYFDDLLTKCSNFKRFTLHKLWHGAKESGIHIPLTVYNDLYHDIEKCENALVCEKNGIYTFIDNGVFEQQYKTPKDVVMNKVFHDNFNYNMKIRITYLNLEDFELDERNVKMLKKFSNLEILILSSYSFRGDFFAYLPAYLKSLKLVSTTFPYTPCVQMNLHFNVMGLRNCKNLKNLVLDDRFLQEDNFFSNLPIHLESLKFVFPMRDNLLKPLVDFKKICLKSFTIELIKNNDVKSRIKNPKERNEILIPIFSSFANFIEFEKLDELRFELDDEVMVLDTKTYEIK